MNYTNRKTIHEYVLLVVNTQRNKRAHRTRDESQVVDPPETADRLPVVDYGLRHPPGDARQRHQQLLGGRVYVDQLDAVGRGGADAERVTQRRFRPSLLGELPAERLAQAEARRLGGVPAVPLAHRRGERAAVTCGATPLLLPDPRLPTPHLSC